MRAQSGSRPRAPPLRAAAVGPWSPRRRDSEIRQACELDPLSLITRCAHRRVLHFARRYAEALDHFRQAIELDDSFLSAHFDLAMSLAELGRYDRRSRNWIVTSIAEDDGA